MSRARLYTDLDETLISGSGASIVKRPGADRFIRTLSSIGDLWLITCGSLAHATIAMNVIDPRHEHFKGMITREDLELAFDDYRVVRNLAPPGFVFDDFPVGSWVYDVKSAALGIGPKLWIQVEPFHPSEQDRGGLNKALAEFARRLRAPQRRRHEKAVTR